MANRICARVLLAFTAIPLCVSCANSQSEPTYEGHTLTYWLQENWYGGPEAVAALNAIGTNTLPFLIKGIKNPQDPLPSPPTEEWKKAHPTVGLALLIVKAFKALGDQAAPLVPELTRLTQDPSPIVADNALESLVLMGTNGFPAVFAALHNPKHPYRGRAAALLGAAHFLGSNAEPAVVELVAALNDPALDQAAAHALGELKLRPDIVVPALARCLEKTNSDPNLRAIAAISLIWFEEKSAPALPYLTNALNDPDPDVRKQAAGSIQSIHFDILRAQAR
jgi:hypothetical protein